MMISPLPFLAIGWLLIPNMQLAEPCDIQLNEVVRLGSDDDPGWRSLTSRVAGVEGNTFFVSPRYAPPQVSAYAPDGAFRDLFDRTGGGPGELPGGFITGLTAAGDAVHVLSANRVLSLDADLAPVATTTLPFAPSSVAALPADRFAVAYPLIRDGGRYLIHIVGHEGGIVRSVHEVEDAGARARWFVSEASDGGFWAISQTGRQLQKYTSRGELHRAYSLPESLADWSPGSEWEPGTVGAQDLGDGHLLLTSLVADGEVPEALSASTDFEPFLDTVLEVLDTRSGAFVAAHRSPEILEPVRGRPGLLFTTEEVPSGNVEVVVSRVRVVCEP